MWVISQELFIFYNLTIKRAENVTALSCLVIFVKFIPTSRTPLSIPRAGFSSLAPWWEITASRSGVLLTLSIFNVPGMGCVCFMRLSVGSLKNRLGGHGYTWFVAFERRLISSRRFSFRAERSKTLNRLRSEATWCSVCQSISRPRCF